MRHFYQAAIEPAEVDAMEATMHKWHKRGGDMVFTDNMNGPKDDEDGDEAEAGKGDVEIGVCADRD